MINNPITGKAYRVNLPEDRRFEGIDIADADFGGVAVVSFDEIGAPDAIGGLTMTLGQQSYRIEVTNMTGQIAVSEVAP